MNPPISIVMQWSDWFDLLRYFLQFSLTSVGGPLVMLPEIHHHLVTQEQWLTDAQFSASVVIAQGAPGPNVLFVALIGWNIGLNAGGFGPALFAATVSMIGILVPSSTLIFITASWVHRNKDLRAVRAFKQGMGPIVTSLMVASGWLLATANTDGVHDWPLWVLTAVVALIVWRTKINMFWLLGIGALLGASGVLAV